MSANSKQDKYGLFSRKDRGVIMELRANLETLGKIKITSSEQVTFDIQEIEKWKKLFNQLRQEGLITGNFDDAKWGLPCFIIQSDRPLIFDLDTYKGATILLKAMVLTKKMRGCSSAHINNIFRSAKKFIINSENFSNEIRLEQYLSSEYNRGIFNTTNHFIKTALELVEFQNPTKSEVLNEILNKYLTPHKNQNRELPNFDDVLTFDEIVNDYFKKYPPEQTLKYSPILIWWLLTNIIPLRPSAFLLLDHDCLKLDSKGFYWIKIRRIKNRYTSNSDEKKYLWFQIDQKTYDLLEQYKSLIQNIEPNTMWYFPRSLYSTFKKNKNNIQSDRDRMTYQEFFRLLREFDSEVVQGVYLEELEKIKPMDTRHFAVINMFLQGFNMLSIKHLAAHEDLITQDNYYSHAEHFVQSYVYRLSQQHLSNRVSSNFSDGMIGWRRYIVDRSSLLKDKELKEEDIVGRVEYGYCVENKENFPNTCIEDCRMCHQFAFNPSVEEYDQGVKWLEDSSEFLKRKISENILMMKNICVSITSQTNFSAASDNLLKTHSRQLVAYMDMKAQVDATRIRRENDVIQRN
jgi:hypothetical protein